jgi:signal transduction histidine kinase
MVLAFIVMIFILNRFVFGSVWSNFFTTLKQVENFDVKGNKALQLEDSEIEEFKKLNKVLARMMDRIQTDFLNLKDLTANTSHEIQTPLAIIKSKAELLMQSERVSKEDMLTIGAILNTTERLSKLNQSLLLITKIENNQFKDSQELNIKEVLEKFLVNFNLLFEAGNFKVSTALQSVFLSINPILLDVLLSNLIRNALMHGTQGEKILISIEQNTFTICNAGAPLKINADDIFKRFVKASTNKNSSGLGLEIVKHICNLYNLPITYTYSLAMHCFKIDFSPLAVKK